MECSEVLPSHSKLEQSKSTPRMGILSPQPLISRLILSFLQFPLHIFQFKDLSVSEYSSLGDSSTHLLPYLHASVHIVCIQGK